jgi:hypothetical protein
VLEVNGGVLRVRDEAVARSEARVKVAARSGADVEVMGCSEAWEGAVACCRSGIEDDRRRRQKSESTWQFQKNYKCGERERESAWGLKF